VASYYGTLRNLSDDPNASVDALAGTATQLQSNPWPTSGWTVLGIALITMAVALFVVRRKRRRAAR
jgi:LPXTG-motif cell wall-anchored protein